MIAIPRILVEVKEQGRKSPSLRGLYYILLDRGLIKQKSDDHYHTLSVNTTEARLELNYKYKGKPKWDVRKNKGPAPFLLEIDALRDESKPSHQDIPEQTPEEFVTDEIVQRIRHPERYYIPNRWYNQEHFVIVVIEKSALFEDFLTIIEQENLPGYVICFGWLRWYNRRFQYYIRYFNIQPTETQKEGAHSILWRLWWPWTKD
jgi:hypothetical protein